MSKLLCIFNFMKKEKKCITNLKRAILTCVRELYISNLTTAEKIIGMMMFSAVITNGGRNCINSVYIPEPFNAF